MSVQISTSRSYNMSQIRSKDTKPEELVRKYLYARGFRYRKNDKDLPGTPDIVLAKYHAVVFVNGCFWHHHDCPYFEWPKNNAEFWKKKIEENVNRDFEELKKLEGQGWRIFVVWECELKKNPEALLMELCSDIQYG